MCYVATKNATWRVLLPRNGTLDRINTQCTVTKHSCENASVSTHKVVLQIEFSNPRYEKFELSIPVSTFPRLCGNYYGPGFPWDWKVHAKISLNICNKSILICIYVTEIFDLIVNIFSSLFENNLLKTEFWISQKIQSTIRYISPVKCPLGRFKIWLLTWNRWNLRSNNHSWVYQTLVNPLMFATGRSDCWPFKLLKWIRNLLKINRTWFGVIRGLS